MGGGFCVTRRLSLKYDHARQVWEKVKKENEKDYLCYVHVYSAIRAGFRGSSIIRRQNQKEPGH
jgi:hypothetical protein